MNKYLPGDRLHNTIAGAGNGTVIGPRTDSEPGLSILWDGNLHPNNWTEASIAQFLIRQPIEPGCWVRYPWLESKQLTGQVVEIIEDFARVDFKEFHPIYQTIPLSELIRVEGPKLATKSVDHLKQAQQLAQTLHDKHFNSNKIWKVGNDLTTVLHQIDNMTANMVDHHTLSQEIRKRENLDDQIKQLAEFIIHNVIGEPSGPDEGAVQCAIRIIADYSKQITSLKDRLFEQQNANVDLAKQLEEKQFAIAQAVSIFKTPDNSIPLLSLTDWLARNDPNKRPDFKRGQLVIHRKTITECRIVTPMTKETTHVDLMTKSGTFFCSVPLDNIDPIE